MKRLSIILLAFLLSSAMTTNAQNLKSILKKHFVAVGQDKINKAEAVVINGKISQMGMELPFTVYQKQPGKVKFEAVFQEKKLVQVFDGKDGWAISPMYGGRTVDMGASEKKTMKSMAEMEGRLYNWKKKNYKVNYEGVEDFEGAKLYKIKVVTPDEITETYFINSDTYLVTKVNSKEKAQGIEVESTKIFSDYRDINGYKVPFKTETLIMGQSAGDLVITDFVIKSAGEVPDSLFLKPDGK
jgi:hypothetical protein